MGKSLVSNSNGGCGGGSFECARRHDQRLHLLKFVAFRGNTAITLPVPNEGKAATGKTRHGLTRASWLQARRLQRQWVDHRP